jgi:mannosyltransferase
MNRLYLVVVLIALIAGAYLRFSNLGALEMSGDEGATWAAADAPSVGQLLAIQQTHNAGKLPLHDLMLHGWIAMFGDGIAAMRAMSALFGVATIILMIAVAREVLQIDFENKYFPPPAGDIDMIAALSALICAVSLIAIKYEREARMYGLLLAIAVAQIWMFLRTMRRQSVADGVALALLTAALIAVNLVTAVMLVTEGIWLIICFFHRGPSDYLSRSWAIIVTGFAMAMGLAILSPALYVVLRVGLEAMAVGKVDWLVRPPWWAPVSLFNKATGSVAFPVMAALAAWGVRRAWARAKGALEFVLLWMWAPVLILVIGSFIWRPMFIERYVLYSFPAFFILVALGIWELRRDAARAVATVALVTLALAHTHSYSLKSHDVDWRDASRVAMANIRPDETVSVAPPYAVEAVRYYTPVALRARAVPYKAPDKSPVIMISEHGVNPTVAAAVHLAYPHVLAHARGVVVLSH